jgi:glycosyltransferase involved in cell wall biosynthesis
VRAELPELRVDVVGEGYWHEPLVEHAVHLGVADAVTFHGHVPSEERDAILDASWLMLVPSVKEGWGIAIMEAAARGVPAIAYRSAGGVRESIVDGVTGWLVHDFAGLQVRAEELLQDPVLRNWMADNARARAAGFHWSSAGRQFAEQLEQVRR